MNLMQVKRALFRSECQNFIKDGMSLSEPILSYDDIGLIDNYFVYYEDLERHTISGPTIVFGIYSSTGILAYVKVASEYEFHIEPDEEVMVEKILWESKELYEKYFATYEEMRNLAFSSDCTNEQKKMLKDYYFGFRNMYDANLLKFYRIVSPQFFDWIEQFQN